MKKDKDAKKNALMIIIGGAKKDKKDSKTAGTMVGNPEDDMDDYVPNKKVKKKKPSYSV